MKKQIRVLNPSKTALLLYDRYINLDKTIHLLEEDEIRFVRSQGFIIAYDKPSVKITKTIIIK